MPHISLRSLSLAALPAALALAVVAMPAQAQNRDDRFVLRLSAFNPEAELGFSGNGTVTDGTDSATFGFNESFDSSRDKRQAYNALREIERSLGNYLGAITLINVCLGITTGLA